jgi:HK97 family phage major capsid protein
LKNFEDIAAAVDQMGAAHKDFIQKHASKIDALSTENATLRDRLEEIESRNKGAGSGGSNATREQREHVQLFTKWMRAPHNAQTKNALAEFESKAVTLATGAEGGFALPEEISRDIGKLELQFSPVRRLVKVQPVGSGDYKALISKRGATSGWVGESTSRTETATPTLRERAPTFGELYAYPQTTEWALDDVFFNVAEWLAQEVAQEFAQEEGLAVISGNGTNKPTGMINTPPVTTADFASPERSANAYQFIDSDLTPGASGVLADSLIDLVYAVNSMYRANGAFVMNSLTAAAVRKLKDSNGAYVWQAGLFAGQPDRLLGYPVEIWEQMPNVGAGNFPVAFGDFKRGYLLADRTQLRITVDANITTPGRIKYFVRRRVGGHVLDNHAVKFIRSV